MNDIMELSSANNMIAISQIGKPLDFKLSVS